MTLGLAVWLLASFSSIAQIALGEVVVVTEYASACSAVYTSGSRSVTVVRPTVTVSPEPFSDSAANRGTPFVVQVITARNAPSKRKRQIESTLWLKSDGRTTTNSLEAAHFHINSAGQIMDVAGNAVSTSTGIDYSVLGVTSTVESISTRFVADNLTLLWQNSAFDGGNAQFYSFSNGSNDDVTVIARFSGNTKIEWKSIILVIRPVSDAAPSTSGSAESSSLLSTVLEFGSTIPKSNTQSPGTTTASTSRVSNGESTGTVPESSPLSIGQESASSRELSKSVTPMSSASAIIAATSGTEPSSSAGTESSHSRSISSLSHAKNSPTSVVTFFSPPETSSTKFGSQMVSSIPGQSTISRTSSISIDVAMSYTASAMTTATTEPLLSLSSSFPSKTRNTSAITSTGSITSQSATSPSSFSSTAVRMESPPSITSATSTRPSISSLSSPRTFSASSAMSSTVPRQSSKRSSTSSNELQSSSTANITPGSTSLASSSATLSGASVSSRNFLTTSISSASVSSPGTRTPSVSSTPSTSPSSLSLSSTSASSNQVSSASVSGTTASSPGASRTKVSSSSILSSSISNLPSTTTSLATSRTVSTTSSAAPTPTDESCPSIDGGLISHHNGTSYIIGCGDDTSDIAFTARNAASNFTECVDACDSVDGCMAFTYIGGTNGVGVGTCLLKSDAEVTFEATNDNTYVGGIQLGAYASSSGIMPSSTPTSSYSESSVLLSVTSSSTASSSTGTSSMSSPSISSSRMTSSSTRSSTTTSSTSSSPYVLSSPTPCSFGDPQAYVEDDAFCEIDLPFSMRIYGSSSSTTYANTNGFISIGTSSTAYQPEALPSTQLPSSAICPYWEDLCKYSGTTQGIFYQFNGDGTNVTYEYLVGVAGYPNADPVHFTVGYSSTKPGVFTYTYYATGNGPSANGVNASVGIQGISAPRQQQYAQYSYASADITPGLVVKCDTNADTCVRQ